MTKTLLDGLDMLNVEAPSCEAADSKRQTESVAFDMALVAASTIRLRLDLPLNLSGKQPAKAATFHFFITLLSLHDAINFFILS